MIEWKPIGDLFDYQKGTLQSTKSMPGKYTFVTAAEEWKTHNSHAEDCEALVFAMAASGSLGRTHYIKGKFIASDLCFILKPKKGLQLDLIFYYRLFNFMRSDIVKKTATGTSKLAINKTNFGVYKLPYFDYAHQVAFRDKIERIFSISEEYSSKSDDQLVLLKQLRQAVLQEAIEGRLTAEWRKEHPEILNGNDCATKLLQKILVEKERLIKEGKLRKEPCQEPTYSLPLSIPKEWASCRLVDISKQVTDGTHQTPTYVKSGEIFLSAQNVKPFRFIPDNHKYITKIAFEEYRRNRIPKKGDLLIARVGAGIGETAVIDQDIEFAFYVSLGLIKVFDMFVEPKYLAIVFNSPYGIKYSKGNVSSGGTSAGNFNLGRIRAFEIPLPSYQEQKVIIAQVERYMAMIDVLEEQISKRKEQYDILMQVVLHEAFSDNSTTSRKN